MSDEQQQPEQSTETLENSGNEASIPDWVSDPDKAYAEIQRLRTENGTRRTENNTMTERLDQMMQTLAQLVPADAETDSEPDNPLDGMEARMNSLQMLIEEERSLRQEAERRATLSSIAADYDLPAALAERIRGETEEEMREDAQALAALLPSSNQPTETSTQNQRRTTTGVPGGDPSLNRDEERRRRFFGG